MQGLLWARCRPRLPPAGWIGHRFRTVGKPKPWKHSNPPSNSPYRPSGGPHKGKWRPNRYSGSEDPYDFFPGLATTDVSEQTVLAFFRSNALPWTMRRDSEDRLVSFGASPSDAKRLLSAFARAVDSELFESSDAIRDFDLLKLRGTDSKDADIVFSNIFFRWLASQGSVRGVDPSITTRLVNLSECATVMHPGEEYPMARKMQRKIIMHVGPTNSGKTYHALRALAATGIGVYAGPLRLLAYEIWERLNLGQIPPLGATAEQMAEAAKVPPGMEHPFARKCNMITGEEQKIVALGVGDTLISCTVEMLQLGLQADVAVIDEIQMIGDPERGFAWTRAVLGMCAKELHLCGEETAVPLIRELLKETGDEIIVNRYERLTPLEVAKESLEEDIRRVQKGDCIVAFSRSAIFAMKHRIEKKTGMKCAVVYGRLPPETRSEQAALFNDPDSGYDILIGSDAIGMGLNLKIRRIVFESIWKNDGDRGRTVLSVSQMKQIAGRAGRFGMQVGDEKPGGFVTTFRAEDLPILRKTLKNQLPPLSYARISPSRIAFSKTVTHLPPNPKTETSYLALAHAGRSPAYCRPANLTALSLVCDFIDRLGHFTVMDKQLFMQAPFPWRDRAATEIISSFLSAYSENMHVDPTPIFRRLGYMGRLENAEVAMKSEGHFPNGRVYDHGLELLGLETFHKILVAYMWLSFRNPVSYSSQTEVQDLKERLEHALHWCLEEITASDGRKPAKTKKTESPIVFRTPIAIALENQAATA
ncbi:ATP-dependent RNA helicase [Favolaschia claudopus]|uniref:RNA helicase n=1 Tax=Favolaschia claudopus TaxID=2862362 RepID=A0AAW0CCN8_9AGAR